jgi:hypothetical protein
MFRIGNIVYFDVPGPQNTDKVVDAVVNRLSEGNIKFVIVASITGETALKIANRIKDLNLNVKVVCVSGPPQWDCEMRGRTWPYIQGEIREKLKELNVEIVERAATTLAGGSVDYSLARYGLMLPSWAVLETLVMIGGYGLKTAVEVVLMATDYGAVPPFIEAIAVAGTLNKGADTAIVVKTTYSPHLFSSNSDKRMQIFEILAMPRNKKWFKRIGVWEFEAKEVEEGETL